MAVKSKQYLIFVGIRIIFAEENKVKHFRQTIHFIHRIITIRSYFVNYNLLRGIIAQIYLSKIKKGAFYCVTDGTDLADFSVKV